MGSERLGDGPTVRPRRPYTLRQRKARLDETRLRITAAAFELHATLGPSRTTISAIADRAGVQRHTVYHHFPDLDTLYAACTAHGLQVSGVPDPEGWASIGDPLARLRHGLAELFAWFRRNERMLATILGDAMATEMAEPPAADGPEPDLFDRRMGAILQTLSAGWTCPAAARPALAAVLAHAIAFETWRSLTRAGLSDEAACNLLVAVADGVTRGVLPGRAQSGAAARGSVTPAGAARTGLPTRPQPPRRRRPRS